MNDEILKKLNLKTNSQNDIILLFQNEKGKETMFDNLQHTNYSQMFAFFEIRKIEQKLFIKPKRNHLKILLIAPCPDKNQRHNSMAIPQLTLSLIAGMTPEEHEVSIVEEVNNDIVDFDVEVDV